MRIAILLFLVASIGCGQTGPGVTGQQAGGETVSKVDWEKKREHYKFKGFQPVAYWESAADKRWMSLMLLNDQPSIGAWEIGKISLYQIPDVNVAKEKAKAAVTGQGDIKVSAVLDMFTKENPETMAWFVGGGSGVVEKDTAPSEQLAKSLRDYIEQLKNSQ
jgi:hypothetical protein